MAVINNNKYMLDRPMWEQLTFAPVTGVAGSCNCDDNRRFIYNYFQKSKPKINPRPSLCEPS